jgi:hypothetical protein
LNVALVITGVPLPDAHAATPFGNTEVSQLSRSRQGMKSRRRPLQLFFNFAVVLASLF